LTRSLSITTTIQTPFRIQDGVACYRFLLDSSQVADWKSRIDARYLALEAARRQGGPAAIERLVGPGQRFVATASSLTIGAIFPDEKVRDLLAGIHSGPAGAWIRAELRSRIACDLDQAWVRRQYAPANYAPLHAPHGWHQDGALGFDFLSHQNGCFPSDALLTMATCWIALEACGVDAPGLELVTRRLEALLPPAELTDDRVRARFAPEEFQRPMIEPGDALLFRGDILHRTHVTPAMTKDRTSIELRFFPADNLPVRLKGDRFARL